MRVKIFDKQTRMSSSMVITQGRVFRCFVFTAVMTEYPDSNR